MFSEFQVKDVVVYTGGAYASKLVPGTNYVVTEVGMWSVRVTNGKEIDEWIATRYFNFVPRVTAVRKHLRRIVFGRS